jgi:hypothetical protein
VAEPEPASPWLGAAVDGLPAPLCVLDAQGQILLVNRAWRRFALDNGGDPARSSEGSNYLAACGTIGDVEPPPVCEGDDLGVLRGLRDVLAGARENFEVEYPCHAPNEERWYVMGVTRLEGFGPARALVTHLPVTQRRRAEQAKCSTCQRAAGNPGFHDCFSLSLEWFPFTFVHAKRTKG